MKKRFPLYTIIAFLCLLFNPNVNAQMLRLPDGNTNYKCKTGRLLGATNIDINWNAPGVKGREGKIWGTDIVWYGFKVMGFGSNSASPWRAGADECTNFSFSTDIMVNGKPLAAGKYAFLLPSIPTLVCSFLIKT